MSHLLVQYIQILVQYTQILVQYTKYLNIWIVKEFVQDPGSYGTVLAFANYPGSGVGGPCLPINSYQFLNTAKRVGMNLDIINTCRKMNEQMPQHVVELTLNAFKECNIPIENSDILILGISYKPDVKDIQLTPAEEIIKKLQNKGAKIHLYDPYFSSMDVFGIHVNSEIEQIISNVDASIIVTGHSEFKKIPITTFKKMRNPILIDTRGIIKPIDAKDNALIFRGLGRGTN